MVIRTPIARLRDMQSALRELKRYIKGKDLSAFRGDRMLRAAVERQL